MEQFGRSPGCFRPDGDRGGILIVGQVVERSERQRQHDFRGHDRSLCAAS
jgi:hypothetical protein